MTNKPFYIGSAALAAAAVITAAVAQDKASAREREGAVVFGLHCSVCHGQRLLKDDAAYDLTAVIGSLNEAQFVQRSRTARGPMPSFANILTEAQLADVYAYVKRGHTRDLDDVPMEANH